MNERRNVGILKNVAALGVGPSSETALAMERGVSPGAILGAAKEAHADLIFLGARGVEKHLTVATHFSDSIPGSVVANAGCPVLPVHT